MHMLWAKVNYNGLKSNTKREWSVITKTKRKWSKLESKNHALPYTFCEEYDEKPKIARFSFSEEENTKRIPRNEAKNRNEKDAKKQIRIKMR